MLYVLVYPDGTLGFAVIGDRGIVMIETAGAGLTWPDFLLGLLTFPRDPLAERMLSIPEWHIVAAPDWYRPTAHRRDVTPYADDATFHRADHGFTDDVFRATRGRRIVH